MKNQTQGAQIKLNGKLVESELASLFPKLTPKDFLELRFDSKRMLLTRKNSRGWEVMILLKSSPTYERTTAYIDRKNALAAAIAFQSQSEDWNKLLPFDTRPSHEVEQPLIKCVFCKSAISASLPECPFCTGVLQLDSPAKKSEKTSLHNLQRPNSYNLDYSPKARYIMCAVFVACILAYPTILFVTTVRDMNRQDELVRKNEEKNRLEAERASKEEEKKVAASRYSPSTTSSDSLRPKLERAAGRISKGTALYYKNGKRFGLVIGYGADWVEVMLADTIEVKESGASVYSMVFDRSTIAYQYYVKVN